MFPILYLLTLVLIAAPYLPKFFGYDVQVAPELLIYLSVCGWLSFLALLISRTNYTNQLDKIVDSLDLASQGDTIEDKVYKLSQDFKRFQKLYGVQLNNTNKNCLSERLCQVAQLAFSEMEVNAVELSLFDEYSNLWTESILIGFPRSELAQSFLLEAATNKEISVEMMKKNGVIVFPISFAGYLFGTLRIELLPGLTPENDEIRFSNMLAMRCAMMLIDARFNEEVLRMRRLSDESIKAKTGFLANLSHEIRGPLGVILSGIELVAEGLCGEVNAAQSTTLSMLKQNGDHLLELVNDVLDYAKTEAGKIKAEPVQISANRLLTDMANVVRSQAVAKKHKLVVEQVDKTLGVVCDKRHIRQILINLLTNAIKYTPDNGTITISAKIIDEQKKIQINVKDTGIGIPAKHKAKVFGAFERIDDEYAKKQLGTGIGMAIAKNLVELNEGSINFESVEGNGSDFWIVLPSCVIESEEVEVQDQGQKNVIYGNGEHILIVGGKNKDELDIYRQYLRHHKFVVTQLPLDKNLLEVIKNETIDAILIDDDSDDLSKNESITIIRNNLKTALTPIVVTSTKAFVFDIEHFLKLGVDRCLTKPIRLSELGNSIRQIIDETKSKK
ncbi:MAG: HAMP domain-containing histidine kinase [Deltaproteobacteria bacterium]|jgi:signal transduction histidine kinase|nr:HAMP domain-containing histidine kinase [Deltaproteobacteria bacterium]